ncbi:hypothetical protein A1O1_02642 [Capronia coronata CBS 617.96]|uniref:Uncharacterized protein n=1 Tax=Capronia coronata CBS 617.96 TaxID=1182541 RepID=W9ZIB0_9EURO|nr:uncharacterized protein A1O1_02642 [Capronia coronata CBS 617.96]EXJ94249.1 hypothetical protein A1O1_02642 [Capronia coronata CBS 617.96]
MSLTLLNTVLLSSLLATTYASVPVEYPAVPSDLDTERWIPYTTLEPIRSVSTPTATPSSAEAELRILPFLDANMIPDLKRQVTGQGAAAAATAIQQVSPVTTYYAGSMISGSQVQVPVVYTQTFPTAYEQWPSPTAGEIGLGTIQGTVGVVKTKRSLPTQVPLGQAVENLHEEEKEQEEDLVHPLLSKLKKAGKEIHDEIVALLNKQKKKPIAVEHEQLEKEVKMHSSAPVISEEAEQNDVVPLEKEQKKPSTQSATAANDARILEAGTLAVLAVGVATLCMSYL